MIYEPNSDLLNKCKVLADFLEPDIDKDGLFRDITDCRMLLVSGQKEKVETAMDLINFIVSYGDESLFPNLRIALQILLTLACSVASCERSFSKLKLILNYLRATMGEQRLSDLALLSIERLVLELIPSDKIIDNFALKKARRVAL